MAFMMKHARRVEWTKERIDALTTPDVRQLRANAERLNDAEIVERCDAVLGGRPRGRGPGSRPRTGAARTGEKNPSGPGEAT
ncbi:MAG: hypothetical protein ACREUB_04040 [Burkholderiales bacterium]